MNHLSHQESGGDGDGDLVAKINLIFDHYFHFPFLEWNL